MNDTSVAVEEMTIRSGDVRIDMAVLNGHMHGFEIKSDRDTLQRLPKQIEEYARVFDYLTLVTGPQYVDLVASRIPPWVGLASVGTDKRSRQLLVEVRDPLFNSNTDPDALTRLLWKQELILCHSHFATGVKTSKLTHQQLAESLALILPHGTLRDEVRRRLKIRLKWQQCRLQLP